MIDPARQTNGLEALCSPNSGSSAHRLAGPASRRDVAAGGLGPRLGLRSQSRADSRRSLPAIRAALDPMPYLIAPDIPHRARAVHRSLAWHTRAQPNAGA